MATPVSQPTHSHLFGHLKSTTYILTHPPTLDWPRPPHNPLSQRLCRKDAVVFAALAQGRSGGEVGAAFNTTKHSVSNAKQRLEEEERACECGLLQDSSVPYELYVART